MTIDWNPVEDFMDDDYLDDEVFAENEDFPDDALFDLDMGFDPYCGCYTWDC